MDKEIIKTARECALELRLGASAIEEIEHKINQLYSFVVGGLVEGKRDDKAECFMVDLKTAIDNLREAEAKIYQTACLLGYNCDLYGGDDNGND